MITLTVLVLFIILILFSVFKGPVEKNEVSDENEIAPDENIEVKRTIDPAVNINVAFSSNDISKCNNDQECEDWFYFASSRKPEDCDMIKNEELRGNCKKNIMEEGNS